MSWAFICKACCFRAEATSVQAVRVDMCLPSFGLIVADFTRSRSKVDVGRRP